MANKGLIYIPGNLSKSSKFWLSDIYRVRASTVTLPPRHAAIQIVLKSFELLKVLHNKCIRFGNGKDFWTYSIIIIEGDFCE